MTRFIIGVLTIVAVLVFGDAVLGIDPSLPEMLLVIVAFVLSDFAEGLYDEFHG